MGVVATGRASVTVWDGVSCESPRAVVRVRACVPVFVPVCAWQKTTIRDSPAEQDGQAWADCANGTIPATEMSLAYQPCRGKEG